jgi:glycosyltransferase involved in cell wall biosynthesis
LRIRADQTALIFSGKLSQRKGPSLLVQAVKLLPACIREKLVLLFLGEGELKESLKAACQQAPEFHACFLGFQNQTCLSRFYHAADMLILPSIHSETWGLVVNDALHHGLPCLVSEAVGSGPDLVIAGQTGEICQTGSIEALAQAIERGLKLVQLAEVRLTCRKRVSGYSVQRAAEGIARAFREVSVTADKIRAIG